jgi:large subunit ribosomal protein L24
MKISQGDTVIVITGKDRGKKGTVMRVLHDENRLIISGINMATKHTKKTADAAGKKIRFEASIHASNVMVADPKTGKPTRIGFQIDATTGRKVRIAKKSKTVLAKVKVPKATKSEAGIVKDKEGKPSEKPAAKKSPFWKKVGFGAEAITEGAAKTESGPASATVTHTRSAGRGS